MLDATSGNATRKPRWVDQATLSGEDKHGLQLPLNDFEEPEASSDSHSEGSDESDVFHAAVTSGAPPTFEDVEQRRALALSERLRDRPLLPPHPQDATQSWTDVRSGVKCPLRIALSEDAPGQVKPRTISTLTSSRITGPTSNAVAF